MSSEVFLREACLDDCDMLFEWANDDATRKNSFNSSIIEYESHCRWFKELLEDKTRKQFILMNDNIAIGQVRLTLDGDSAEIGYSVDEKKRGLGYGKVIISKAIELVRTEYPEVNRLVAKVKPSNVASVHCFVNNGFIEEYVGYQLDMKFEG